MYKYAEKHIDVSIEKIGGEVQKNPPRRTRQRREAICRRFTWMNADKEIGKS
jgi:hypothetical protein